MANNELLDAVMNKIESEPYNWDQDVWRTDGKVETDSEGRTYQPVDCGTSFCFAGWACQLGPEPTVWFDTMCLYANESDNFEMVRERKEGGQKTVGPEARAQRLLDLDADQADLLFASGAGMEELKYYVAQIKDGVAGDLIEVYDDINDDRQDEED